MWCYSCRVDSKAIYGYYQCWICPGVALYHMIKTVRDSEIYSQWDHKRPQLRTWSACGLNCWNGPQFGRISHQRPHFTQKILLRKYIDISTNTLNMHLLEKGIIQGVNLTRPPLKVLSVRLHSKSHQKSSKCQNLLTGWHLELLGGGRVKKNTLYTPVLL